MVPVTMKAPGDRRKNAFHLGGVIQIHLGRACNLACTGCTQASQLRGKAPWMTPSQFRVACESLADYYGVVGVFGGSPCLHPEFRDICTTLSDEIEWERRGLWSNNLNGHGALCRATFNPNVSNLNVHQDAEAAAEIRRDWPEATIIGEREDSRHSPPWVAMQDMEDMSDAERWELIAGCDVNQFWSAMVCVFRGELRGYFCEIAAAQAMLHQHEPDYPDLGVPIEPGWWKRPMRDFADQVGFHCFACGVPLRGAGDWANGDTEYVSKTHADVFVPKKKRSVVTVTKRSQLGSVERSTNYTAGKSRVISLPQAKEQP